VVEHVRSSGSIGYIWEESRAFDGSAGNCICVPPYVGLDNALKCFAKALSAMLAHYLTDQDDKGELLLHLAALPVSQ
jgi:hypothetical protein